MFHCEIQRGPFDHLFYITYTFESWYCKQLDYEFLQLSIAGNSFCSATEQRFSNVDCGLKQILENPDICHKLLRSKFFDAVDIVRATTSEFPQRKATLEEVVSWSSCRNTIPMDDSLFSIVRKYGERILLKESDRKPKTKKKGKKQSSAVCKEKQIEIFDEWCSPPPWDLTLGGDGCPKFLCDVMVCFDLYFVYELLSFQGLGFHTACSHSCNGSE